MKPHGAMVRVLVLSALGIVSILSWPLHSFAQVEESDARRLVEAFVAALNGRDGPGLTALFAEGPYRLCGDLDALVFNELNDTDDNLRFANIVESRAVITGGPAFVRLAGGRTAVTFGLEWTFRLAEESEPRVSAFVVEWRVERLAGVVRITNHRSREVGTAGSC